MAKTPTPDESPQEKDDLLSDDGLDDLDIESLLEEDIEGDFSDRPADSLSPKDSSGSSNSTISSEISPSGGEDGDVFDDGEIDLLADDIIDISTDISEEADSLPKVNPAAAAIPSAMSFLEDDISDASGSVSDASGPEVVGRETVDLANEDLANADAANKEEPAPEKKTRKKKVLGRKKGAKKERVKKGAKGPKAGTRLGEKAKSKKEKKAKTKKEKAAKPPREKRTREKAKPAAGSQRAVAFICSECYEEFLLPSNYSQQMVTCPECLHVGKKPDEDFLRTVNVHKAGQSKSLLMAAVAGMLLALLLLSTLYITSDMYVAAGKPDSTLVLGLAGGTALVTVLFLWLVMRFEKNRWEVYF